MKTLNYHFALISPFTYMGHEEFARIVREKGTKVVYHPFQIGKVFAATGGLPPGQRSPQRQAFRLQEMQRWKEKLGLSEMKMAPAHFPVDESIAVRCVLALQSMEKDPLDFIGACHRVVWEQDRNLSEESIVVELLTAAGFDAAAVMDTANSEAITTAYAGAADASAEAGVFGAPTYIIDEDLFWGQDRLDWVENSL